MDSSRVIIDLADKIELEKNLLSSLKSINKEIVRSTTLQFATNGTNFDSARILPEIEAALSEHYLEVAEVFGKKISDNLPADIKITDEERDLIFESLILVFAQRSREQARIIAETNQRNINKSISDATLNAEGFSAASSRQEIAVIAAAALSRVLRSRVLAIATLETQASAEASKATEVDVLIGRQPSALTGDAPDSGVQKQWVTVGDERVRRAHVMADSDTVDLSDAFIVDGERLRWPGDLALGASLKNVMNCRCASVHDLPAIYAIRRRRNQVPRVETIPTEQLIESLG